MTTQRYENYWKITLAYTNIYSEKFNESLNIIVNFIDNTYTKAYSQQKYKDLQNLLRKVFPISAPSTRKAINEYIKLGFINPRLESYRKETLAFIRERDKEKKKTLFSKIVYSYSSFDRSVTKDSKKREINFLIKTLTELKNLSKNDILGLMTKDVSRISKGYLTKNELEIARNYASSINLISRKYNQLGHLWSILSKLDNLVVSGNNLYLEEDAIVLDLNNKSQAHKRDPYLQIIYKNGLKEECMQLFGKIQCMLENLDFPPICLIASHIKPFNLASDEEAYDPNNGLLLGRNMDSLFDQGFISFKKGGKIMVSNRLTDRVKNYLSAFSLDNRLLNEKREAYLEYHRSNIFTN